MYLGPSLVMAEMWEAKLQLEHPQDYGTLFIGCWWSYTQVASPEDRGFESFL